MFLKFLLFLLIRPDLKQCPRNGFFAESNTSCKSYKVCSDFRVQKYSCPTKTLFDQRAQDCVLNFICPDTSICPLVPPGFYADPNYSNNRRYYIECLRSSFGIEVRYRTCAYGYIFQPSSTFPHSGKCIPSILIPKIANEITPLKTTIPIPPVYCEKEGIFPIYHTDCESYMICENVGSVLNQVNYRCSSLSFFDPWKKECDTAYTCLESICLNQVQGSLHPHPNDPSKTKYCQCAIDSTGVMIPLYLQCEAGYIFDDLKKICLPTIIPIPPADCTKEGIFPIYHTDCVSYMICEKVGSALNQVNYRCSSLSFFDPWKKECDTTYTCLESICLNQIQGSLHPHPNDPSKTKYCQCTIDTAGVMIPLYLQCEAGYIFDDLKKMCVPTIIPIPPADCTKEGIFPIYHTDCVSYMICEKVGSLLNQVNYRCSSLSFFDPWKKECDTAYTCLESICSNQIQGSLHPHPNDPSKTKYCQCTIDTTGVMVPLYLQCEAGYIFDDLKKMCVPTIIPIPPADCTKEGIFPIYHTDCVSYMICEKVGSLLNQVNYRCSSLSFFDPWQKECDTAYTCLESICLNQIQGSLHPHPNDPSKTKYCQCAIDTTGVMIPLYLQCEAGYVFDDLMKRCVPTIIPIPPADCTKEGVFPIYHTDCTSYMVCEKVVSSLNQVNYRCSSLSFFDPWKKECDTTYTCLESICLNQIQGSLHPHPNDPSKTKYCQCTIDTTGVMIPLYLQCEAGYIFDDLKKTCVPTMIPIPPADCTKEGVFPIYHTDCTSYMICEKNGTLLNQVNYRCSSLSFFDPWKKECDTAYTCLENICLNQIQGSLHSHPNDPSKTKYCQCTIDTAGVMIPLYLQCEAGYIFDDLKKMCVTTIIAIPPADCTKEGIFPIYHTDCASYMICEKVGSLLNQVNYRCSSLSFFDPWKKECDTAYTCLENICLNQILGSLYPHPNDPSKMKYCQCTIDTTGVMIPLYLQCEAGYIFDDLKKMCVQTTIPIPPADCTKEGMFPIYHTDCASYMICEKVGSLLNQVNYRCSSLSFFDPWKKECDTTYTCLESICLNQIQGSLHPHPNDPSKTKYCQCTIDTTGVMIPLYLQCEPGYIFDDLKKMCVPTIIPIPPADCTKEGIFPIYHTDCASYMICEKVGSLLNQVNYRCSSLSFFDPWKKECDTTYTCLESICLNQIQGSLHPHPNDPSKTKYCQCTIDTTGVMIPLYLQCEAGYMFDDLKKMCVQTIIPIPPADCTKEGIFPIYHTDCTSYMICQNEGSSLNQVNYRCSSLSFFDPWKNECDTSYTCLESICLNQIQGSLYPHPNDPSKTKYCQCTMDSTGVMIPLYLQCETGYIFDDLKKMCVPSTTPNPSTDCTKEGIFPIYHTDCTSYMICQNEGSSLNQVNYRCSSLSFFDPWKNECDTSYTCLESICLNQIQGSLHPHPSDPSKMKYCQCAMDSTGVMIPLYLQCEAGYVFDDLKKICVPSTIPNPSTDCTKEGIFPIYHTDCTSYMVCQKNGSSLNQVNYRCSSLSFFDPWKNECDTSYTCLESICLNQIQGSLHPHPNDPSKTKYCQCIMDSTGVMVPLYLQCETGYVFDDLKKMCVPSTTPNPSTDCTKEGIFPIYHTDCTSYMICQNEGSSLNQVNYRCSSLSFFDPWKKECDTAYTCLESICLNQIQGSLHPHPNDPSKTKYCQCTMDSTGVMIPLYLQCEAGYVFDDLKKICVPSTIPNPSTDCTKEGIFPIYHTDCTSYMVCQKNGSSLNQVNYRCSSLSFFDPWKNECDTSYTCLESICLNQIQGSLHPHPNDPSKTKYCECTVDTTGVMIPLYLQCETGFIFDDLKKMCVPSTTPNPSTDCTKEGIFPIYHTDCTSYMICQNEGSSLNQVNYRCSSLSFFDPWKKECDTAYICLETICLNQIQGSLHPHPNDPSKTKYCQCTRDSTGIMIPLYLQCDTGYIFDDLKKMCVPSTTPNPSTECTKEGIFPIYHTDCTSYMICQKDGSSLNQVNYRCSSFSFFDPWKNECDATYLCLESICLNQIQGTLHPHPNDPSKTKYCQCTMDSTGVMIPLYLQCETGYIFDNLKKMCVPSTTPNPSTDCTKEGIFPIYHTDCTSYMICQNEGSSLNQVNYRCSSLSFFDPWKKECDTSYTCLESICLNQIQGSLHPHPNDSSKTKYCQCIRDSTGVMIPLYLQCEVGYIFDDSKKTCVVMPESTTEVAPLPTIVPLPSTDCTKEGIFLVYHTECTTYMICQKSGTSLNQLKYRCSTSSLFDPWKNECVVGYTCLESRCLNQVQGSFHPHPNDPNKTKYFQCAMDTTRVMIPLYLECGAGYVFDDAKKICVTSVGVSDNVGMLQWISSKVISLFGNK